MSVVKQDVKRGWLPPPTELAEQPWVKKEVQSLSPPLPAPVMDKTGLLVRALPAERVLRREMPARQQQWEKQLGRFDRQVRDAESRREDPLVDDVSGSLLAEEVEARIARAEIEIKHQDQLPARMAQDAAKNREARSALDRVGIVREGMKNNRNTSVMRALSDALAPHAPDPFLELQQIPVSGESNAGVSALERGPHGQLVRQVHQRPAALGFVRENAALSLEPPSPLRSLFQELGRGRDPTLDRVRAIGGADDTANWNSHQIQLLRDVLAVRSKYGQLSFVGFREYFRVLSGLMFDRMDLDGTNKLTGAQVQLIAQAFLIPENDMGWPKKSRVMHRPQFVHLCETSWIATHTLQTAIAAIDRVIRLGSKCDGQHTRHRPTGEKEPREYNARFTAAVRRLFKVFDANGSGFLSAGELSELAGGQNSPLSAESVQILMATVDQDGNGKVSLSEFDGFMRVMLRVAYDRFDRDRSGVLDADEVERVARVFGKSVPAHLQSGISAVLWDRPQFVRFVLEDCLSRIDRIGAQQGLRQLLALPDVNNNVAPVVQRTQAGSRTDSIHKLFRALDCDDNGHLDRAELAELGMMLVSDMWGGDQTSNLLNQIDKDGDGQVSVDELEALLVTSLSAVFNQLDSDGSHQLDGAELHVLGQSLERQIQSITGGNRQLSSDEWLDAVLQVLAAQIDRNEVSGSLKALMQLALPVAGPGSLRKHLNPARAEELTQALVDKLLEDEMLAVGVARQVGCLQQPADRQAFLNAYAAPQTDPDYDVLEELHMAMQLGQSIDAQLANDVAKSLTMLTVQEFIKQECGELWLRTAQQQRAPHSQSQIPFLDRLSGATGLLAQNEVGLTPRMLVFADGQQVTDAYVSSRRNHQPLTHLQAGDYESWITNPRSRSNSGTKQR